MNLKCFIWKVMYRSVFLSRICQTFRSRFLDYTTSLHTRYKENVAYQFCGGGSQFRGGNSNKY